MLDWIGDVGGLTDGLKLFFSIVIYPIAKFGLSTELLARIFGYLPNENNQKRSKLDHMTWALGDTFMKPRPCCPAIYLISCSKNDRKYRKKTIKSDNLVKRELDLINFIHTQRRQSLHLLTSLKTH